MKRTMFPRYFHRIPHLRTHDHSRNHRRSVSGTATERSYYRHNRTRKRKVHNISFFYRLRTKSLVEKMRGPLLQPEVRAVQVAILIHTAYSHSPHTCHRIIPPLSTASRSYFRSTLVTPLVYMLRMLFDRDTNKEGCCAGTSEHVAAAQLPF